MKLFWLVVLTICLADFSLQIRSVLETKEGVVHSARQDRNLKSASSTLIVGVGYLLLPFVNIFLTPFS
ncbi:unnamed protein product [Caenorhabditis auriculariae]|uniref:Uncharacterized protein n=1 Tax=Caenorhabditis auriculariae TaxID=2777116 RepID=A0A8S1HIA7_9PELO|nr:unnamed protein product [Caenorhabditis auriculariae]